MRLLSCLVVWTLCAVGYAQSATQAATPANQPQPKVAAARATATNAGYWYRAWNGRWYWHAATQAAPKAAPAPIAAAPQQARVASAQAASNYSNDRNRSMSQLPTNEQLLLLQQQVSRLQQSMDAMRATQSSSRAFMLEEWQNRKLHGEAGGDPLLFQ